jgi:hypothetical protein
VAYNPPPAVPGCAPFTLTGFNVKPDGEGQVLVSWSTRGGCPTFHGDAGTTSFSPSPENTRVFFQKSSGSASVVVPLPFYCHGQTVVVAVYLNLQDGAGDIIQPTPTGQTTALC